MATRRNSSIVVCFALFAAFLFLTHYRLLPLPYFWDEAGQFISQAHDLFTKGLLIPESAAPNSHPPGLPLMLAALWKLTGVSIPWTRGLMLLFGAAFLTASFLLAIELLRGSMGAPALMAAGLMLCNPLVFTQSMMAQLDLPSALFTTLLLLSYVQKREGLAIASALLAVAFKETSIAIPVTLAVFAWRDGRMRFASMLAVAPALLIANWFLFVYLKTGHLFGDASYAQYNLFYPLHPLRLGYALLRRFSYLFLENLHVIPAGILLWRWRNIGFSPIWLPVAAACAVQTIFVSVTGGAVLERYLLPVLPLLYAAFAAGLSTLPARTRNIALGLSCAGLLAGLFLTPPWPFALENNLTMVDAVEMQQAAAGFAEIKFQNQRVTTAWPLTDALRKPYLGYAEKPLTGIRQVDDLSLERLRALEWRSGDILILYSRAWNPETSLARWPVFKSVLRRFFSFPFEARLEDMIEIPQLKPMIGYRQRGMWVEILYVP